MNPPCPVCKTPAKFFMKKDGFDEYKCPRCDLSFVFPLPKAEWLKENIYSYESGYQANKKTDLSLTPEDKRAREILSFLAEKKPHGKFLDVGCSSGQYMYWASKRGFFCAGVEINKRTADIAVANGFKVFNGFLEDAKFEKESFDVVFVGDVIEHVPDPRTLMRTCVSLLKKDGILVISTPNVDCFWSHLTLKLYQWFGIPWSSATPPHHVSQFSFYSLNLLLKEQNFLPIHSLFARPPSLKYELGSLHLYKHYKQERMVGSFLHMIFSFGVYSCVYALNTLLSPFLTKDFYMAVFYERHT